MSEALFDLEQEYDEMLNQGIRLSGEGREFFIQGRVMDVRRRLRNSPRRILDFGCGTGNASHALAQAFPDAEVVGIDTSERALDYGRQHFGSDRLTFQTLSEFKPASDFDLCYVNGVFHHIELQDRPEAVGLIYRALRPGGYLALFENNPWNPGTRMVMSRIPFDRDAKTLTPPETKKLVLSAGFRHNATLRSLFYFPRFAAWLRPMEPLLAPLPLGAQYYVWAQK